jgi:hypothetical protein
MTVRQKVKRAEKLCDYIFYSVYGHKFDSLQRPDNIMSPYDVVGFKDEQPFVFELKYSPTYRVDDFETEGAMIEIDKWNNLVKITNKDIPVYYARFYKDGYVLWLINKIDVKTCLVTFYERAQVTVSGDNKIKKTNCLLLPFDSALEVSKNDFKYIKNVSAIKKHLFKRGRKKALELDLM